MATLGRQDTPRPARVRGRFLLEGRVQGVCYRMSAREEACRLGLTGWVRNLPDGGVEILAEGIEQDVVALLGWCRHGPPQARVTDVKAQFSDDQGSFSSFAIRF